MKRALSRALRPLQHREPMLTNLMRFPDEFGSFFDNSLQEMLRDTDAITSAAVDVKETNESFKFVADLPGLKKEEVNVKIEPGNVLSISGERTREAKEETDTYHRLERSTGRFLRRFQLPENVDVQKVSAACENGVLHVIVPKIPGEEPKEPEAIDVKIE